MKKIITLLLCALLLCGCTYEAKKERTVFSMDTHIELTVYGNCDEAILDAAEAEIKRINDKFSVGNIQKSDDETIALSDIAEGIKKSTAGAFDINIAPVMDIWGFYSEEFSEKNYRVPSDEEIKKALLDSAQGEAIDFGGIAKGYCADKVVELLKENGVEKAVISLGGNVAVMGTNPEGKPWNVGVMSPFDGGICATVSASDKMIVTSGDYMRYFEQNGKKYHHIINPATGYPAESDLTSVTVIADNGAYADALSTALFVMGKDKAQKYWNTYGDFEMILITKDKELHYTEGIDIQTDLKTNIIKRACS